MADIFDRLQECHTMLVFDGLECNVAAAALLRAAFILEDINPTARAAIANALRNHHDDYCQLNTDCLEEQTRFVVDSLQEWAISFD